MLASILFVVIATAPVALVLLVGLGLAGLVFARSSPAAGGVLAAGVVILGGGELLGAVGDIALSTPLMWSMDPSMVELFARGLSLAVALVRALGIVGILAAACVGPAPVRDGDR
jgi:hypothetical protein